MFESAKQHPNWDKVKAFTTEEAESFALQNQTVASFRMLKLVETLMSLANMGADRDEPTEH